MTGRVSGTANVVALDTYGSPGSWVRVNMLMRDMKVCEGYIMSRAKLQRTCPERTVPMRTCFSGDAVSLGHSAASDVRQPELCALKWARWHAEKMRTRTGNSISQRTCVVTRYNLKPFRGDLREDIYHTAADLRLDILRRPSRIKALAG